MKYFLALLFLGVALLGPLVDVRGETLPSATQPSLLVTPSPLVTSHYFESFESTEDAFGPESVDFTWLFLKTILAMIVVIALAVLVLRYILPRLGMHRHRGSSQSLQIEARLAIDSKKGLYVVQAEGRRFLIAASEHFIGPVAELDRKNDESPS